jgi:hypothetical protein
MPELRNRFRYFEPGSGSKMEILDDPDKKMEFPVD